MSKTNTMQREFIGVRAGGGLGRWALGAAVALGLAVPAAAQSSYSVVSLGTLGGDSQANALSLGGAAAGQSALSTGGTTEVAFLTPAGGAIKSLGTLGGTNSFASGLIAGASTQVVGFSDTGVGGTQHAFLYTAGGTGGVSGNPQMRDLGTLSGTASDNSLAFGINSLGQIVGNGINTAGNDDAFRTPVGQTTLTASDDLGTLGGTQSTANAVNTAGQAVGYSTLAGDSVVHAFRTAANGSITAASDLGSLGGNSSAAAINTIGQVAGDSVLADGNTDHAVLWTQGATGVQITDIGALAKGDFSQATGINDSGTVVGFSNLSAGGLTTDAFLYQNGKLFDLNSLISPSSGWTLEDATAINNAGQVAGYGLFGGVQRAFLLTPTPEPSSLVVLAIAAAGTAGLIARKRRQRLA